jgi:hypothetical protein
VADAFLSIDEGVWRDIRERVHRQIDALGETARLAR